MPRAAVQGDDQRVRLARVVVLGHVHREAAVALPVVVDVRDANRISRRIGIRDALREVRVVAQVRLHEEPAHLGRRGGQRVECFERARAGAQRPVGMDESVRVTGRFGEPIEGETDVRGGRLETLPGLDGLFGRCDRSKRLQPLAHGSGDVAHALDQRGKVRRVQPTADDFECIERRQQGRQ